MFTAAERVVVVDMDWVVLVVVVWAVLVVVERAMVAVVKIVVVAVLKRVGSLKGVSVVVVKRVCAKNWRSECSAPEIATLWSRHIVPRVATM